MSKVNMFDMKELDVEINKSIKGNFIYIKDVYVNNESYEYKILIEQDIDNVNKMQIEYDGNKVNLLYDINNKITLENYLLQKKLNVASLLLIIKNINNLLNSISNYLLSENSITLDFRTIVIDREGRNTRLKFCLVPNLNNDFSFELSKFLMKVLRYVDIKDKNALPLAYKLFIKSSKDNYTIDDLLEVVKQYEADSDNLYDIYDENLIFDENMLLSESDENKEDFVDLNSFYQNDEIKTEKKNLNIDKDIDDIMESNSSVVIDDETKKLLNSFDEEKEVVHAHIKINPLKKIFTPFVSLIVPMALYLGLSESEFKRVVPMILIMECVLLISTIINAVKKVKKRGLT